MYRYIAAGMVAGAFCCAQAQPLHLPDQTISAARPDPTAPGIDARRAEFSRIPGGAAVLDAERYRSGRSSTLQDALGLATGVFVQPRFGAEEARLSIRGSGLQRTFHGRGLLLMQDGAPLTLADGSFDFQAVEPLAASHVEVLRGANAWRYGATNLGGAINFVTPTGRTAPPADVRLEAGSFGYQRLYGGFGQDFGEWDGFFSLAHSEQSGFRQHATQRNQRYFANLGGRVNERLATRFYLTHVDSRSELPGSLTQAQLRADPGQANAAAITGDQRRDFRLNRLGNITTLALDGGHSLSLATFYAEKSMFHPIFQVLNTDSEDMGARLTHSWLLDNGVSWTAGLEAVRGESRDRRFQNEGGRSGRQLNALDQRADNLNVFAELDVPLDDRWAVTVGGAWVRQERDIADRLRCNAFVTSNCVFQDESVKQTYRGSIGRLGIRRELGHHAMWFANLSQSFEPPTFGELTGGQVVTPNDAQRATTAETGIRWTDGQSELDLAIYRSQVRDELLALNDAAGQPLGTVNAPHTLRQGVELGGSLRLGALSLQGQYLFNDFRFDDDPVYGDNRLAGIPRQLVKGEMLWRQLGWYAGPTFEWVPGSYHVDHARTLSAEGYVIWGLKAGYRQDRGLGFFVEGRNLSDRVYAATTGVIADAGGRDSAQFLPGDGRALFAGLEWRP